MQFVGKWHRKLNVKIEEAWIHLWKDIKVCYCFLYIIENLIIITLTYTCTSVFWFVSSKEEHWFVSNILFTCSESCPFSCNSGAINITSSCLSFGIALKDKLPVSFSSSVSGDMYAAARKWLYLCMYFNSGAAQTLFIGLVWCILIQNPLEIQFKIGVTTASNIIILQIVVNAVLSWGNFSTFSSLMMGKFITTVNL